MGKKRCKKCNEIFLESSDTFKSKYLNLGLNSFHVLELSEGNPYNDRMTFADGSHPKYYDYSFYVKIWLCPNCKHEELSISTIYGKDTDGEHTSIGGIITPLPELVPENARNAFI